MDGKEPRHDTGAPQSPGRQAVAGLPAGHDEVDEVVSAWRRERPDLSVEPMEVWSRIHRLSEVLAQHRKRSFAGRGLENWEFDVLAALRKAGEPYRLSPGQLIRETHVTSGTMTNRIDRLRSRGLVTREQDPSDGRAAVVALTEQGRELVDSALTALLELEASLLQDWSPQESDALASALRRLLVGSGSVG